MRIILRLLACVLLFVAVPATGASPKQHILHVLIVGNSLTYFNELPWMLSSMTDRSATRLDVAFCGASGMRLKAHVAAGRAAKEMAGRRWDYVIIQGQSTEPADDYYGFLAGAEKLVDLAKRSGATPLLLETWSRRGAEQRPISDAYRNAATKLGVNLIEVGRIWQELQGGGIDLYAGTNGGSMHPNLLGSYLAACAIYAKVAAAPARGLPFTFSPPFREHEFYRESLMTSKISRSEAEAIQSAVDGARTRHARSAPN